VIEVVVGEQDVRRFDGQALGGVEQWLDRTPGIHEEAGPTLAVGDEIGVRQEALVQGALDDHGRILPRCRSRRAPEAGSAVPPPGPTARKSARYTSAWGAPSSRNASNKATKSGRTS